MTIHRSEIYKAWVRTQPCIVHLFCSGKSDAHHEDILKSGGTGCKGHDCQCLPLCRLHHQERHQLGKTTFYEKWNIDPMLEIIRHNARYMAEKGIK